MDRIGLAMAAGLLAFLSRQGVGRADDFTPNAWASSARWQRSAPRTIPWAQSGRTRRRSQLERMWEDEARPFDAFRPRCSEPEDAREVEVEPTTDATGVESPTPGAEAAPLPYNLVEQSSLPRYAMAGGVVIDEREAWRRVKNSTAVCLGELHDNPYHHNLQLRALRKFARAALGRRHPVAVGYEMFQRPFQQPLSQYVSGRLGEVPFLAQSQYADRWGYDFALYRPLLEATAQAWAPALALNAPRELTRAIGREGLESLSPELAAQLPDLDLADEEHRDYLYGLFGAVHGDPESDWVHNYYVAQTTWDETMAASASEWLLQGPRNKLMAFAGVAHCHRSAIPRRVERRTGTPMLSVAPVMQSEWLQAPDSWEGYDLLFVLDDSALAEDQSTRDEELAAEEPVDSGPTSAEPPSYP